MHLINFGLLKICFRGFFCSALGNLKGRLRRLQASEKAAALQPMMKDNGERQCCRRDCCSGQNRNYGAGSSCCAGDEGDFSDRLTRKGCQLSDAAPASAAYSPLLPPQLMPG
jgi:hypothetical protein